MTALSNAEMVHQIYLHETYAFPTWVLQPDQWVTFQFGETLVIGDNPTNIEEIKQLAREREPCNIGMKRYYDQDKMEKEFGWRHGAYETYPHNIAIYCRAKVKHPFLDNIFVDAHVIHLVGLAFDDKQQPDYQMFAKNIQMIEDAELAHVPIAKKYCHIWKKAIFMAKYLQETKGVTRLQIYNVGGGAFAGPFADVFILNIFEPAFRIFLPYLEKHGITVQGYDFVNHRFDGGHIPECLFADANRDQTLYVNAWDPWSLVGNGNKRDNSLDGMWGRHSNVAVLTWPLTNPFISYCTI
jgi:hypothetical protein